MTLTFMPILKTFFCLKNKKKSSNTIFLHIFSQKKNALTTDTSKLNIHFANGPLKMNEGKMEDYILRRGNTNFIVRCCKLKILQGVLHGNSQK